jgi:hypothetical protein
MGFYLYRKDDHSGADKEMKKAMELGSPSFVPPYYRGMALLRIGFNSPEVLQEAVHSFEKAAQINPQFAPAFEGLAHAYAASPETQKQAVEAGIKAVKLDPTMHEYAVNLVYLLLNIDRDADARLMAQKLLEKATSPEEAQTARSLLERIKEHEEWVAQRNKRLEEAAHQAATVPTGSTATGDSRPATGKNVTSGAMSIRVDESTLMATEGSVRRIDCSQKPAVIVTLSGGTRPLIFHAADFHKVGVSGADPATMDVESCEKWKGRRMRIWFHMAKSKEYMGEITDVAFE